MAVSHHNLDDLCDDLSNDMEVINDSRSDSGKAVQSLNKNMRRRTKDCDFKYKCEWISCSHVSSSMNEFNHHVSLHRRGYTQCLGTDEEAGSGEYMFFCQWQDCNAQIEGQIDDFSRHVFYHTFHQYLKFLGQHILTVEKLESCHLDTASRNVIPELPEKLMCRWLDCGYKMASHTDASTGVELKLKAQMKDFPHFTHLDIPVITQERLRALLVNLEEESDSDDLCKEETISKLNFKSWIYTKLEDFKNAEEINKKVLNMTNWQNVMSVGNYIFLMWRAGKEREALISASRLEEMKTLPDFDERLALAKAELAYCYSRVGGPQNVLRAIRLLEEFVQHNPGNFFWKLRLGLAYRRSTNLNVYAGMSGGPTIQECYDKALNLLSDVVDNSSDNKLRGPACSELALFCKYAKFHLSEEDYARMFRNKPPTDFCKEALQFDADSTWVMTNCGRAYWPQDGIPILEKCLRARKHTTTHHHLGSCYIKVAKYEAKQSQQSRERYRSQNDNNTNPEIKLPNEKFNKAEQNFIEAIRLSHNQNVPAIFDLGSLYLAAGEKGKALEMFNQITNKGGKQHLMTIIRAYEQAGLIYLKMKGYETLAEDKLTKAISLAFNNASCCLQNQAFAAEMWHCFWTMKDNIKKEQSPTTDSRLILLYELVKNHHKVVRVVEKLLDGSKLNDPGFIRSELNGYLKLNETEKALAFLNVSVLPGNTNSGLWTTKTMIELKFKVLLRAAEHRLKVQNQEARFLFQELFQMQYGGCVGDDSEDIVDLPNVRDVLFLYDKDNDTEEGLSQTGKNVETLQDICSNVFGLNTSKNLQGTLEFGYANEIQLGEMKKCQVLAVVLGTEKRNQEFEALLKMIPSLETGAPKTVLIIDTSCGMANIPDVLKQYRCYHQSKDVAQRFELVCSLATEAVGASEQSQNQLYQGETLETLMQLFCFIIQQTWPCS